MLAPVTHCSIPSDGNEKTYTGGGGDQNYSAMFSETDVVHNSDIVIDVAESSLRKLMDAQGSWEPAFARKAFFAATSQRNTL